MANAIDLIGEKFGRLKVLGRNPQKGNRRQVRWDCICECGNKHIVTGESLRFGKSKSCGCLLRESRYVKNKNTDRELAMLKLLYSPLKKRHRNRFKKDDYIDFDTFKNLSLSDCYYCGVEPRNTQPDVRYETRRIKKEKIIVSDFVLKYNGIDRIDSSKGYIMGNVRSCCKTCNSAKNDLKEQEFYDWIKRLSQHTAQQRLF